MLILGRKVSENLTKLFEKASKKGSIKIDVVSLQKLQLANCANAELRPNSSGDSFTIVISSETNMGIDSLSPYGEYLVAHELLHLIQSSKGFPKILTPRRFQNPSIADIAKYIRNITEHYSVYQMLGDYGFDLHGATKLFEDAASKETWYDPAGEIDRIVAAFHFSEFYLYYALDSLTIKKMNSEMPDTFSIMEKIAEIIRRNDPSTPIRQRQCFVDLIRFADNRAGASPRIDEIVIVNLVIEKQMLSFPASRYLTVRAIKLVGIPVVRVVYLPDNTLIDSFSYVEVSAQETAKMQLEDMVSRMNMEEFLRTTGISFTCEP